MARTIENIDGLNNGKELWRNPTCEHGCYKEEVARNRYQCTSCCCEGHMCMGGMTCDECGELLHSGRVEGSYFCANLDCKLHSYDTDWNLVAKLIGDTFPEVP